MWLSENSPVVCHRMEEGGKEGRREGGKDVNAESSRAWGNPFFPLLQLHTVSSAEEHLYCPVRAALASNYSRGFDCIRRAVHR